MMCKLISSDNKIIEIPYYEMENTCKFLVDEYLNSENKKEQYQRKLKFYKFIKQYKTFSPYFDFVLLHMGFTLQNPLFISDTILKVKQDEGINYYFAEYQKEDLPRLSKARLSNPILMQGKENNITRIKLTKKYNNIPEGFITSDLNLLSLKGCYDLQDFWASLWLHELIKKRKDVCEDYLQRKGSDMILYNPADMLLDYYPWIRFCSYTTDNKLTYLAYYNGKRNSELQNEFLKELQIQRRLTKQNMIDISEE